MNLFDEIRKDKVVLCQSEDNYCIVFRKLHSAVTLLCLPYGTSADEAEDMFLRFDEKSGADEFLKDVKVNQITLSKLKQLFDNRGEDNSLDLQVVNSRTANLWQCVFLPKILEWSSNTKWKTFIFPPTSKYEGYKVDILSSLIKKTINLQNKKNRHLDCFCVDIPPKFKLPIKSNGEVVTSIGAYEFEGEFFNVIDKIFDNENKLPRRYKNEKKYENIKNELTEMDCWISEKLTFNSFKNKFDKMIVNSRTGFNAKVNDSSTWTSFENAKSSIERFNLDGIGFVLSDNNDVFCIDLDIQSDGTLSTEASIIYNRFLNKTYIEYSASHGIHIFARGKIDGDCTRGKNDKNIELYKNKHAIMFTGDQIGNCKKVNLLQKEIDYVYDRFFIKEKPVVQIKSNAVYSNNELTEEKIIEKLSNGKNKDKFLALMNGDISGYDASHNSYSEADLALCSLVAFFTDNENIIDSIYKKSKLYTAKKANTSTGKMEYRADKWDRERTGGSYGQQTIRLAINTRLKKYEPEQIIEVKPIKVIYEHNTSYLIKPTMLINNEEVVREIWIPKDKATVLSHEEGKFINKMSNYLFLKNHLDKIIIKKQKGLTQK